MALENILISPKAYVHTVVHYRVSRLAHYVLPVYQSAHAASIFWEITSPF